MAKHENNGRCQMCAEIIDRYPGFHLGLRAWFEALQRVHPEAHVSCAGRGRLDQDAVFRRKASRARWGESAHNFNAALDLFEMGGRLKSDIYEQNWFQTVIAPNLPEFVEWYGRKGAKFFELPHVEVKNWRQLVAEGRIALVLDETKVA